MIIKHLFLFFFSPLSTSLKARWKCRSHPLPPSAILVRVPPALHVTWLKFTFSRPVHFPEPGLVLSKDNCAYSQGGCC